MPDLTGIRFWGSAEYLLWWLRGQNLPPLLTTSPPGTSDTQAGVLGTPGTAIVVGNSSTDSHPHSGGRFTLGYWLDDHHDCGVSASFFLLCRRCDDFATASPGSPILSRPFFDPTLPGQAAELLAFPNVATGHFSVSACTELLGADAALRKRLWSSCDRAYRIDGLIGYRFLRLRDSLVANEFLTSIDQSANAPPIGTSFDILDRFQTTNYFHGGDLGLQWQASRGKFSVDVLTKVALGCTERITNIQGSTTISVPGQAPMDFNAGILALDTNSGQFSSRAFSVVPEVRINLGYQLSNRLRAFVGYNFLYWNNVSRAGDQVDLRINPNFVSPAVASEPRLPAFVDRSTSFWAHGVNVGLAFNY